RINPDVDAETHPYISTGLKENKFGIPMDDARSEISFARGLGHVKLVGLDCHIGSQLVKTGPFEDALGKMAALAVESMAGGAELAYFDV
ncbi:hypothetical protein K8366_24810, partial [Klebsiella aerogenes]|nr:hypothetical protein [Klebsiella aerogenes]